MGRRRWKLKDDPHGEESLWSFYPVEVIIKEKERKLDADIRLGFQRGINFEIENIGEATVENITWTITITRRGLIQRELLHEHQTIGSLGVGDEVHIKEMPRFGFWPVTVNLKVESDDIDETIEKDAKGFIMFRFIRLRRYN